MAIALIGGHVSRALDFYNKEGKYFVIGGTEPWEEEALPPSPLVTAYQVDTLVALKKVENTHLVVPDKNGSIIYRDDTWRIVQPATYTTLGTGGISSGSKILPVRSLQGITQGTKIRVGNLFDSVVVSINAADSTVSLKDGAPQFIAEGQPVEIGAYVEDARYVYIDCTLAYDTFPIVTYRQIGIATTVTPDNKSILRSAAYATANVDEFTSLGTLEVLDYRPPITRQADQSEKLSLILEF